MNKKFILNADDFGLSLYHNLAVLKGYETGILTSASLCANTEAFEDAVDNVVLQCENLGIGVHLNIMEGKSLTCCPLLTDNDGYFNRTYAYFILNQNNKELLHQIENEFRAQIEKVLERNITVDHLDSHVHTHAIPEIFKITCKFAIEYNINYVRTQNEKLYLVYPEFLSYKFMINVVKILLLKYYTYKNKRNIKKYNLRTNDFIIGVGYTGMMSSKILLSGLSAITTPSTVETLIHPCKYDVEDSHVKEFKITQNTTLQEDIENLGFLHTNYTSVL